MTVSGRAPTAFVIGEGNTDVTRPLGLAGIRCVAMGSRTDSAGFSRYVERRIPTVNAWREPDRLVEILIGAAGAEGEPPVLIYQGDGNALLVSRYRDVLAEHFRFAIPSEELMETLNDKLLFQELSDRLDLPVPAAVVANPKTDPEPFDLPFPYPIVVKPAQRRLDNWSATGGKAGLIEDRAQLAETWSDLRGQDESFILQELVPGPESAVVSYHAYVAEDRTIVGEFTGEKIRTKPAAFGHSCSVRVLTIPEVAELGRRLLKTLDFTGVVKFDFKRRPGGGLALFEVNTKFNLWHLPGAIAGVNIPALVYNDLTGQGRPSETQIERENVVWCKLWDDLPMALSSGVSIWEWLRWIVTVESWRDLAWDDPMAAVGIPLTALAQISARIRVRSR